MANFFYNRRYTDCALDGLAVIAGLLISIPCFALQPAPLWSGL